MSPKPALKRDPHVAEFPGNSSLPAVPDSTRTQTQAVSVSSLRPVPSTKDKAYKLPSFQPRIPVITGEAAYRGLIPVDGIISGNLGATGNVLTIKQKPTVSADIPELNGDLAFKDMLRINGYVAGTISSRKGTLIVDGSARVDASIDVSVCVVSGTVNGDVVALERVELGPAAVVNGDISTASLCMKPGAIFTGNCRMIKSEEGEA